MRQSLKKADKAIGSLQRSFRARRELAETRRLEERQLNELRHMLLLNRKKAMRSMRDKQFHALEILPAGKIWNPELLNILHALIKETC